MLPSVFWIHLLCPCVWCGHHPRLNMSMAHPMPCSVQKTRDISAAHPFVISTFHCVTRCLLWDQRIFELKNTFWFSYLWENRNLKNSTNSLGRNWTKMRTRAPEVQPGAYLTPLFFTTLPSCRHKEQQPQVNRTQLVTDFFTCPGSEITGSTQGWEHISLCCWTLQSLWTVKLNSLTFLLRFREWFSFFGSLFMSFLKHH